MKDIYELLLQVYPLFTEVEEKPCTEYEKLKIKESLKKLLLEREKWINLTNKLNKKENKDLIDLSN